MPFDPLPLLKTGIVAALGWLLLLLCRVRFGA